MAGNAVETMINIKGVDKFLDELKTTPRIQNIKYKIP